MLAAPNQSMIKASNNAVKREPASDHGTPIVRTPCSAHLIRGTSAVRIVLYWQVGR